MIKKYIFKVIRNILIILSALLSLLSIVVITLCLYILINKSLIIYDNDNFFSKIISWYFDRAISFESLQIESLSKRGSFYININNFNTKNYKSYKSLKFQNIKLNFSVSDIIKEKYFFSKIEINSPTLVYESNHSIINNNEVIKLFNNLLSYVDTLYINNGNFIYENYENKYFISQINIYKEGSNDFSILGDFKFRDNYLYKVDKKFTFKSNKILDQNIISINFFDLFLPNFILNKFDINDNLIFSSLFSGNISFNIHNNKILNAELNAYTNDANIYLKKNLQYKNFTISNFKKLKSVSLNVLYDFNRAYFIIKNLTFIIKNNNDLEGKIILSGDNLLNNKKFKIDFIFDNIFIKDFVSLNNDKYYFFTENIISGKGSISILEKFITDINFIIDDTSYKQVIIKDIKFVLNKNLRFSDLYFTLKGNYTDVYSFFKIFNINNLNILEMNNSNGVNAHIEFDVKLHFTEISEKYYNFFAEIEGNFIADKAVKFTIHDNVHINNIHYKINFNKDKIEVYGEAMLDNTKVNFSYFKLKDQEDNINFNFNIDNLLFDNKQFIKGFKGYSSFKCNIKSEIQIWVYLCTADFKNAYIYIPTLNFTKDYNESAYLNFSGIINNNFSFDSTKFYFVNNKTLLNGEFKFNKINNSYYINFYEFVYNKNNLKLNLTFKNNDLTINIHSGILNLNTFLNSSNNIKSNIQSSVKVRAELNELIIFDDIVLHNSNLSYINNNLDRKLNIIAKYYSDEQIIFNLNNTENSKILAYDFKASNAGKLFNLLKYKTEIKDGLFSSEGFIGDLDNDNDIMGTISIDKFRIMKAPLFTELLLAASLTGLFDVLNNEGIFFDQFDAQFNGNNNIFTIKKSRAYGFSLGLTGKGLVNSTNKTVNINGSIVPAYKLNTLFNNIPIIGEIFSGKEDEGIFAINYLAKGKWDDPDIEVNPLSALTPGIIRNIFDY